MGNSDNRFRVTDLFRYLIVLAGLVGGLQMAAMGQQAAAPVARQEVLTVQPAANTTKTQLTSTSVHRLFSTGRKLSSVEAETLEKTLAADPTDLATRLTLIAYYTTRYDETFMLKKSEHVLWVIRNVPDNEALHDFPFVRLMAREKGFVEAQELWLTHLETHKGNQVVLINAADFFLLTNKPLAEKLIKQLAAADPEDPRWPSQLAHLYSFDISRATGEVRRVLAAKAYPQYELAYKLTNENVRKRMLLAPLASTAFEAGEVEKAKSWALQALSDVAAAKPDWSTADSVHHAHITLGRIALLSENLVEAKQHLIAATQVKDSAVLVSFGPNMMLAKELLEKGERDSVLQYFQECASFWKKHEEILNQWTSIVKHGQIPDFGANLVY